MADPPPSVDWRGKGVLPPVRNQGMTSLSGAIAVVEAIEALAAIKTGKLLSLSVQEVVTCCSRLSVDVYTCIKDIRGLALDDVYPRDATTCLSKNYKPAATISGGSFVTSKDERELALALAKQPVVIAVDAGRQSFMEYRGGVYSDSRCNATMIDHNMLLVGYTEDSWICQNSWGKYIERNFLKNVFKMSLQVHHGG